MALTLPLAELEFFFGKLEEILQAVKSKTGFLFAPVILQRSLFCPDSDFMIILHKVSLIDVKLPGIQQLNKVG